MIFSFRRVAREALAQDLLAGFGDQGRRLRFERR